MVSYEGPAEDLNGGWVITSIVTPSIMARFPRQFGRFEIYSADGLSRRTAGCTIERDAAQQSGLRFGRTTLTPR